MGLVGLALVAGCNPVAGGRPAASSTAPTASSAASGAPGGPGSTTQPPAPSGATTAPVSTPPASSTSTTPTTAASPGATSTVAAPPVAWACTIAITYGQAEPTAGPTYRPVIFTNTAATACQLTGGAHAELVGPDGHTVVGRSAAIDGGTTVLAPGASVTSTMASTDTGKFDEERCAAEPVSGVRITPPADAAPTTLPSPVGPTACNGIIRGQLSFTPLPIASEGP